MMRLRLFLSLAGLAMVAACGNSGARVPSSDLKLQASLMIVVQTEGLERRATVACTSDGGTGTGYLHDPDLAGKACRAALEPANKVLLTKGLITDRVCTEIYGGPQKATITGAVRGDPVNATITRTNGCGIADWTKLEALLGPPE
ncbi:MAG: hypothetical protein ABR548_04810 [Actinomycetota bacterium]|nr:hypothetical protein [Actinomycetota bacterium]